MNVNVGTGWPSNSLVNSLKKIFFGECRIREMKVSSFLPIAIAICLHLIHYTQVLLMCVINPVILYALLLPPRSRGNE